MNTILRATAYSLAARLSNYCNLSVSLFNFADQIFEYSNKYPDDEYLIRFNVLDQITKFDVTHCLQFGLIDLATAISDHILSDPDKKDDRMTAYQDLADKESYYGADSIIKAIDELAAYIAPDRDDLNGYYDNKEKTEINTVISNELSHYTTTYSPDGTSISITDGHLTYSFGHVDGYEERMFMVRSKYEIFESIKENQLINEQNSDEDLKSLLLIGMITQNRHLLDRCGEFEF